MLDAFDGPLNTVVDLVMADTVENRLIARDIERTKEMLNVAQTSPASCSQASII